MAQMPADPRPPIDGSEEDTELLTEVLGSDAEESPEPSPIAPFAGRPLLGNEQTPEIPGYEIRGLLGTGGMGRVFLAVQKSADRRQVAIKMVRSSVLGTELLRRFTLERQAMARLNHPAIAQLFGAGTARDGRPFVAMELVDGVPITRYCDERRLGIPGRLRIFVAVCRGVEHAHRRQLLHRDLKPSNLMITERDGEPTPKIIDFGIARALDSVEGETLFTGSDPLGTPSYMSPEAIRPCDGPRDLDTRTDVYSLGVVLYELLVGLRPHDKGLKTDSLTLVQRILDAEVVRPSHRWRSLDASQQEAVAERRALPLLGAQRAFVDDLDWIVMKAIARDREERYGSVAELAADVERFLRHEAVAAGPPTVTYRFGRFVRRNRMLVATAALAVLSLVAGGIGTGVALVRARAAAQQETEARQDAVAALGFLTRIFESSAIDRQGIRRNPSQVSARDLLDEGAARVEQELRDRPLQAARVRRTLASAYRSLGLYDIAVEQMEAAERELAPLETSPETRAQQALVEFELGTLASRRAEAQQALERLERAETMAREASFSQTDRTLFLARIDDQTAKVLRYLARHDEAEARQKAAIERVSSQQGLDEAHLLNMVGNLGSLYFEQHRWAEAETLFEQALEIAHRVLGTEHARTAVLTDNLAAAIASQGRLDEAAPLFRQALEIRRSILPEGHPGLAISFNNLGTLALDRDRPEEAEGFHSRALEIRRQALGEEHPTTAWSYQGLARVLDQLGRHQEAITTMEKALAIRRKALAPGHPTVRHSLEMLGHFWRGADDLPRAAEQYREALAAPSTEPDDPVRAELCVDLAEVLVEMDRPGEVPDLLAEAEATLPAAAEEENELRERISDLRQRLRALSEATVGASSG